MAVGTADRNLIVYNLQNPQVFSTFECFVDDVENVESSYQIRCWLSNSFRTDMNSEYEKLLNGQSTS